MDFLDLLGRDLGDSGAWVPMGCCALWHRLAESCGTLYIYIYVYTILRPPRLTDLLYGVLLDVGGAHHSCNQARSMSRRVGGPPLSLDDGGLNRLWHIHVSRRRSLICLDHVDAWHVPNCYNFLCLWVLAPVWKLGCRKIMSAGGTQRYRSRILS